MRVKDMRELASQELQEKINETRKEIVELRFKFAASKLEKISLLRNSRKQLAQLLTIQKEQVKR